VNDWSIFQLNCRKKIYHWKRQFLGTRSYGIETIRVSTIGTALSAQRQRATDAPVGINEDTCVTFSRSGLCVGRGWVGPTWVPGGWLRRGWVTKILRFGQKRFPNCDFMGLSFYLIFQLIYRWVRREG
jgi:hypothetical protein